MARGLSTAEFHRVTASDAAAATRTGTRHGRRISNIVGVLARVPVGADTRVQPHGEQYHHLAAVDRGHREPVGGGRERGDVSSGSPWTRGGRGCAAHPGATAVHPRRMFASRTGRIALWVPCAPPASGIAGTSRTRGGRTNPESGSPILPTCRTPGAGCSRCRSADRRPGRSPTVHQRRLTKIDVARRSICRPAATEESSQLPVPSRPVRGRGRAPDHPQRARTQDGSSPTLVVH